jgi:hypothetical protein
MKYAGDASRASIRKKTRSGNSGFDFKLPSCRKIARERDAAPTPLVLGDRGVLLGKPYRSLSDGTAVFHRRTASGGRCSAVADIAAAGAAGAGDREDWPAPAVVTPYAAWGSVATLARRPSLLRSLWRVPPTWAYCVESGPN